LDPSRWPSLASNESFASRNQKFSDLVVKCLIKLTKVTYHFQFLGYFVIQNLFLQVICTQRVHVSFLSEVSFLSKALT